jgi:hypothetical protein
MEVGVFASTDLVLHQVHKWGGKLSFRIVKNRYTTNEVQAFFQERFPSVQCGMVNGVNYVFINDPHDAVLFKLSFEGSHV